MAMSENPYEPPRSDVSRVVGVRSGLRRHLRDVAVAQKVILVCILVEIIAVIAQFAVPPQTRTIVGAGYLITSLVATIFVFILAMRVYGTAMGILLGLGALIPCVGLIVLLIVNGKATTILQQNGYQVGLLGADLSRIPGD